MTADLLYVHDWRNKKVKPSYTKLTGEPDVGIPTPYPIGQEPVVFLSPIELMALQLMENIGDSGDCA